MITADQPSVYTLANERMTIAQACESIGMHVAEFGNMKMYCPFGDVMHMDEGMSKSFRIYPKTNTAYCFACAQSYTPVRLIALARDITDEAAAEAILLETNYIAPDFESRWDSMINATTTINTDDLADALKVACERMDPSWFVRQFEDEVGAKFTACLALLPKVHTEEAATKWLSTAREVMRITLGVNK